MELSWLVERINFCLGLTNIIESYHNLINILRKCYAKLRPNYLLDITAK